MAVEWRAVKGRRGGEGCGGGWVDALKASFMHSICGGVAGGTARPDAGR